MDVDVLSDTSEIIARDGNGDFDVYEIPDAATARRNGAVTSPPMAHDGAAGDHGGEPDDAAAAAAADTDIVAEGDPEGSAVAMLARQIEDDRGFPIPVPKPPLHAVC